MILPNRGGRLSRRQRGLLWTGALLVVALLAGGGLLWNGARQRQGQTYRPGESNADITQSLVRNLPADAPRPVFVDVTEAAGLSDFIPFSGARTSQLPEDMGSGVAWGDYDNDGDDDLFLVSAGGPLGAAPHQLAPSALYENLGTGCFRRVTSFQEPRIVGMGAAWGDYDGDGWLDLVVTGYNALLLFRNQRGELKRDPRFPDRPGFWTGAAWADYNNDRRLDLYVTGYVKYLEAQPDDRGMLSQQFGRSVPYTLNPASYEPERNLLFRNAGAGRLVDTAARLGVANPQGRSLSALWHDFDDDGWIDLYVANDISDNVLYRNVRGTFTDISHAAWVADPRGAMGLTAGDWNRDGDDDLFITHWVAQENALYDSLFADARSLHFPDAADAVGLGQIALSFVGWGTEFLDFDSDGWLDLAVANGGTFETEDTPKRLVPQVPFLFWNRRGQYFHNVAPLVPALAKPRVGRGLAISDFDNDGDQDVLVTHLDDGVRLLRNDTVSGRSLQIVLRARATPGAPGVARGASAAARVGTVTLRRAVTSASYLSQSSSVLHFGLGAATSIDRLTVRWRAGAVSEYGPLAAGVRWEITEGDPVPRRVAVRDAGAEPTTADVPPTERERVVKFWERQRAAMHALKVEKDAARAAGLFREALAIDPAHEDSRYYLATSLAAQGDVDGALAQYHELIRVNDRSHRGLAGWGRLRANTWRASDDLRAAEQALLKAYELNPEETGTLLTLGELALMRGDNRLAGQRLEAVAHTNARSVGGLFLIGYLRWKAGDSPHARESLERARAALGPDWKPAGSTAEGDVAAGTDRPESTPLSRFWERWDGTANLPSSYAALDAYLKTSAR